MKELIDFMNRNVLTDVLNFSGKSIGEIKFVIPGSFNPLHKGHINIFHHTLLNYCHSKRDVVVFELSLKNMDKGDVLYKDAVQRIRQFHQCNLPLVVTHCSSFAAKAALFPPGSNFCVGTDTVNRIFDTKYSLESTQLLDYWVSQWRQRNHSFFVFPRNGCSLSVPDKFRDLFVFVSNFNCSDISSTQLRSSNVKN